jgi:nucleotide-binding universal stress UspA family protein
MLWTNVLLAFDSSQAAFRAAEYVGQMFGKREDVKLTVLWVFEKVPEADMVDTPFTSQVKARISVLEREKAEGLLKMEEVKKHLLRMGLREDQVTLKSIPKKKGVARDLAEEVKKGGFGTVVLGRGKASAVRNLLLGSVATNVIDRLSGVSIVVVE